MHTIIDNFSCCSLLICATDRKNMRTIIWLVNVHLFTHAILCLISWTVAWWEDDDNHSSSHCSTEGCIKRRRRKSCSQQQRHIRRRFKEGEIGREDQHEDPRRTQGPAGSFEVDHCDTVTKGWWQERPIEDSESSRSGAKRRRRHDRRRKRKRKYEKRLRRLRRGPILEISANLEYMYSTVIVVIVFVLLFCHSNSVFIALLTVLLFDDNLVLTAWRLDCSKQTIKDDVDEHYDVRWGAWLCQAIQNDSKWKMMSCDKRLHQEILGYIKRYTMTSAKPDDVI